jgi:hypothetical protein
VSDGARGLGLSLAVGSAATAHAGDGFASAALSYGLRLDARLAGPLSLVLGYEGWAHRPEPDVLPRPLGAVTAGLQWWLVPFLYLRAGVGAGVLGPCSGEEGWYPAAGAAAGLDFRVAAHGSVFVELAGISVRLPRSDWNTATVNVGVSFF